MNEFDQELAGRLDELRTAGLYRELRRVDSPQAPRIVIGGRECLNFSSNDYLGLANEPALKAAATDAIEKFGAGSGAARLICGSLAPHHELEETLAAWKGTEAALTFTSGYATAVGTITALLSRDDIVVLDKLVHASIVDAARLSGAKLRVFAHNDLNDLAEILAWTDGIAGKAGPAAKRPRVLVITESVFSMDGDQAPLRELVELKERHGAWLMVDEAHATGLYGVNRRGLIESAGIIGRVEVQMGTLGKALGSAGGYVCGSRVLTDYLVNRARSFIFSTAPTPATAAAATAAVRLVQSPAGEERCRQLWERVAQFQRGFGSAAPSSTGSAIIPIPVGDETRAMTLAAGLRERGVFVPAVRYPTVARGQARLRVTFTAAHKEKEVGVLCENLRAVGIATSGAA